MPAVTTLTLFTFKQNKFWAFKQMGIAAGKLKSVEGLQFFKFLGTGGGSGFSLSPDFSTYAFLGVWNDRSQYNDCMNEHPVFLQYKEKASSQRELVLSPVNSHGKWSGKNPFKTKENPKSSFEDSNLKAVVITRATLRWNRLLSFGKLYRQLVERLTMLKGFLTLKGLENYLLYNKLQLVFGRVLKR